MQRGDGGAGRDVVPIGGGRRFGVEAERGEEGAGTRFFQHEAGAHGADQLTCAEEVSAARLSSRPVLVRAMPSRARLLAG